MTTLENSPVEIARLPSLPLAERLTLPREPAIYFVLGQDNEVLYIGKAACLLTRWKGRHHRKIQVETIPGVRIAWLSVSDASLLLEIEAALIAYFSPPLNGTPRVHPEAPIWLPWSCPTDAEEVDSHVQEYWPDGNKGSVVLIKYHLIWIPRRRRRVLIGQVATRLEELLREKAAELNVVVEHLAIQPDHLHLFVSAPPSLAVSQIVFRLKGYTSRTLRQEFPHLLRLPSMWTTAYYASTAGNVSRETIRRYIDAQSKRD